ncbi:hypothetical protein FB45DRAFT_29096 [Roridomyces roridus]|uniref:F-box domain-containing protein n=1 Tax=Roridomyces roridus TaxID=1738132 RepID=A0AAD7CK85_9AGAR|nr:hypothetical protein FB45DRAFT_29096 [Roridomyces roridus]
MDSLPPELLCIVFAYVRSSVQQRQPAPAATVVRVCSTWREVARKLCPELWTDIRLFHCRSDQLSMFDEYLRLSENLPVDIAMDIPIGTPDMSPLLFRIFRVSRRWRSLHISTTPEAFRFVRTSGSQIMAPLLESLRLSISPRMVIHIKSMPSLKVLVLQDVLLETPGVASFSPQLEVLDICSEPGIFQDITHADLLLRLIAQESGRGSQLRELTLKTTLPRFDGPSGPQLKSYISSVTKLSIGNLDNSARTHYCLTALQPLLPHATLEELTLDKLHDGCSRIILANTSFPALHTLTLSRTEPVYTETESSPYRDSFPALKHLRLVDLTSYEFIFRVLSETAPDRIHWPKLHTLEIHCNVVPELLRNVVESRVAAGLPLDKLEIHSPQDVD